MERAGLTDDCATEDRLDQHTLYDRVLQRSRPRRCRLLVYARRMPELNVAGYVPEPGSRTALIRDADDDLNKLGKGRTPKHH